jgi:organic hydroperoxide reductase OsmC/OhrA
MSRVHTYQLSLSWTGNVGLGTSDYRAYERAHEVAAAEKPTILGSSDPAFRGDPRRWNPEELLVASLSQCHLLAYLHLAASAGVVVTAYTDTPVGSMAENADGSGQFTEVLLSPAVTVAEESMVTRAAELHDPAHRMCFIAGSVNFPVRHAASTLLAPRESDSEQ